VRAEVIRIPLRVNESIWPEYHRCRSLAAQPADQSAVTIADCIGMLRGLRADQPERRHPQLGPLLGAVRRRAGVQQRPSTADDVVEAARGARRVDDPGLRESTFSDVTPLIVEDFPDFFLAHQLLLVLTGSGRILPAMVPERRRAVDGRAGRVAVEAQPVVGIPLFLDLRVDDDPPFGVGASGIADAQLTAGGRRAAVSRDHI
jgi:hypothetical protein